jgi:DNA-binding transcriptional ArsR family regulator/sorbitol-specific phosphotransferase system component IIA
MHILLVVLAAAPSSRADLFRLLGDEDRLRLLALCSAEELTVGELATLLGESQPQVTRKSQALREAGLVAARRDGTRTLLRTENSADPVVLAALEAGRAFCLADGSLAQIPALLVQREEASRQFFSREPQVASEERPAPAPPWAPFLPLLAPLVPGRSLAVDVGAGEGTLLPLLSPIFERVVAVDRSAARLARCAERVAALGLPNVRLREGTVEDASLVQEIERGGGADLVVLSRVLCHAARPQDLIGGAARLLRAGGHLALVDHVPHDDERLREQGHVWLGFEPARLREFLETVGLNVVFAGRLRGEDEPALQLVMGRRAVR